MRLHSLMKPVPNILTVWRMAAVPVVIWALIVGEMDLAFWLFLAAGISDAVDGYVARRFQARTALGSYLDPIADKALLVSAYLVLGYLGLLPVWLVILVVFRDLVIMGGVILLHTLAHKVTMAPLAISRSNTVAQVGLVGLVLLGQILSEDSLLAADRLLIQLLVYIVGLTTLVSGIAYVWIWGSRAMQAEQKS
ncbi:CDP-alcohol phosphatidyltransferase family protein [Oceanibaculum pacificum]|uniref:CDP-diacylglycerol--glycerol-3-phosphate 3-phosphatidyltransferase n=1 Tax=Oceanibaculum pacificum TaxID=580166 RepID=A0A154W9T7_9PROT|nr:CDP-alcohol phosphatidyltransferase family protein [Oceanibaculum pacificum]KZD10304.1 CDP-alcohol phosphatidyltransferase [Oceanibaculum pacificum]